MAKVRRTPAPDRAAPREPNWRALLDIIHLVALGLDSHGRVTYANPFLLSLLGVTQEDIIGAPWMERFIPERLRPEIERVFADLVRDGRQIEHENPVVARSGEERIIKWHNALARDAQGRIVGTVSIGEDVTEIRRVEERSRRLSQVLRAVRGVNQLIARQTDREALIAEACRLLVETNCYACAWIALWDEQGGLLTAAQAGVGPAFCTLVKQMRHGDQPPCIDQVRRDSGVRILWPDKETCAGCPVLAAHPGTTRMAARLEYEGRAYGVLVAAVAPEMDLDSEERSLFVEVGGDIAFALHDLDLREAQARAVKEIRDLAKFPSENPYPVLRIAADGELLYANAAAQEMIRNWLAGPDAVVPDFWREVVNSVLISGRERRVETQVADRTVSLMVVPVPEGSYANLYGRDITDRRRAEKALRESEERFRRVVEQAADGIAVMGADGAVLEWNPAAERITGRSRAEVVGRPLWDVLHEIAVPEQRSAAYREQVKDGIQEFLRTGAAPWLNQPQEFEIEQPDGTRRVVQDLTFSIRPPPGAMAASIIRDVTDQRLVEESLRRTNDTLTALIQASPLAVMTLDAEVNVMTWSPAAERMFGWRASEVIGRRLPIVPEDRWGETRALVDRILAGQSFLGYETRRLRKDGALIDVSISTAPLRDAQGTIVGAMGVLADITERKRLEEQLRQAAKLEAVGQLAGGIAHDFNNLLTGILGHANVLRLNSAPGTPIFDAAQTIERAAQEGADLTQRLLGFARRGKHQNIPVDLHAVLLEATALLGPSLTRSIRLIQSLRAASAVVLGDPTQMHLVVVNLALNARDAMPQGGDLLIETDLADLDDEYCRNHPGAAPGRYVTLAVTDTGTGIPEDARPHLFEPFFTTKSPGEGTGMGLATVYGIVANHGGHVTFYSEVGRGTTFRVYLPLAEGAVPPPADPNDGVVRGAARILVVDDEPVVRDVAARMLRHLGYQVVTVADGVEAVEYYRSAFQDIDLVIVDLTMPRMGGRECFRALRAINPNVRALLSTGFGLDGAAQDALDEGMRGFAQKPYTLAQLSLAVAKALENA